MTEERARKIQGRLPHTESGYSLGAGNLLSRRPSERQAQLPGLANMENGVSGKFLSGIH